MTISANYPAIRPSLLLDFANTQALDPRVTFTRSTTATYYDGKTSAIAEQNLILGSQTIGGTGWGLGSAVVTAPTITANATTAPDGTTTAYQLAFPAVTGTGAGSTTYESPTLSDLAYTYSMYLKGAIGGEVIYIFNTANGVTFNTTACTLTTSWQRFSVTFTPPAGVTYVNLGIDLRDTGQSAKSAQTIYAWGAQLEQRSFATAYNATTTTVITNYIPVLQTAAANIPRFDYNPTTSESLGLLIEQQSTNLVLQSQFVSGWSLQGTDTLTLSADIAPDGTQTFAKFVPSTANVYPGHRILQNVTINNTTVYTFSAYIKNAGVRYVQLCLNTGFGIYANFDLNSGVVGTTTATSSSITAVGNGVYRCTITGTSTGTTGECNIIASTSASAGNFPVYAGDGFSGLYIWGAQLEASSFATSYIPTVASQVTRSVDSASMTGTNFSSWYNIGQGSIYFESQYSVVNSGFAFTFSDNTTNNRIQYYSPNTTTMNYQVAANATTVVNMNLPVTNSLNFNKYATTYGAGSFNGCANGGAIQTSSAGLLPSVNRLLFDYATGGAPTSTRIKKVAYYPAALTSTQLQALTGS